MKPLILFCIIALVGASPLVGGPTGSITGVVSPPAKSEARIPVEKYVGSISGRVARPPVIVAGVWIEGPGLVAPAAPASVTMNQKGYQFGQSLQIVARGTKILFPNEDEDYHNVFSLARVAKFDLGRYKKNEPETPSYTFNTVGLIRLQCEIHQHMNARVLVVESPYFTTTAGDGSFTLAGLPAGNWTLRVQYDEKNQWHAPVTVIPGKSSMPSFIPGPPTALVRP